MLATIAAYSVVVSLLYLAALGAIALGLALKQGGRREEPLDDHDAISASRFTIPVSLLVPLRGDSAPVSPTLRALLNLNYPEFEVIVVAEALLAAQLHELKHEWELEAKEFYYRQSLTTADVQKIYRSAKDARLMVVEKAPTASRADALNCGVNLARFRYVGAVDPGLVFDADALLRAMSAPLRDPAGVVAATSHVEVLGDRLATTRALMDSRLVWRRLKTALGPQDAVAVWRRDAIVQLGGFSMQAADPDFDMMARLQTSTMVGRVVRSTEIFGQIAPRSLASSIRFKVQRQFAALETLWSYRTLARPTFLYVVLSEVITPLVLAWIVLVACGGAVLGWLTWRDAALALILLSFGNAVVSAAALLLRGSAPGAPDERTLTRLLLVAPLDFLISGGVAAYARGAGLLAFVKGALVSGPTS